MEWRDLNRNLMKAVAVACAIALPLTACNDDDDPIAPPPAEEEATLELAIADDGAPVDENEEDPFQRIPGELQADIQVQLFDEGAWVNVTGLPTSVTLQLGAAQSVLGSTTIDPGTYDGARVVMTNATVTVPAGTEIGEEPPLEEDVTVTLAEGEELVLHHDMPVIVQDDGTVQILVNVNSYIWMDQTAVTAGAVDATQLETAMQITVQ